MKRSSRRWKKKRQMRWKWQRKRMKKEKRKRQKKQMAMTDEPLAKELYDILACPVCKGDITYTKDKTALLCKKCKVEYPIKEGIPIMLPPEMREQNYYILFLYSLWSQQNQRVRVIGIGKS